VDFPEPQPGIARPRGGDLKEVLKSFMSAKHIFHPYGALTPTKSPALSGGLAMPGAFGLIPG
jgi:hypothetical protein